MFIIRMVTKFLLGFLSPRETACVIMGSWNPEDTADLVKDLKKALDSMTE